jgi:hypothetical protein
MRCHRHPERIAPHACVLCGRYHCDECLENAGGEPVCPACHGAALAAGPAVTGRRPGTSRLRTALGLLVVAALVAALAVLAFSGRQPVPDPRTPSPLAADAVDETMAAAVRALEQGAVAVETFRAESGDYPRAWDDLVPDLLPAPPDDPWSPIGGSLVLTEPGWDPAAVLLYSVGPDGSDDSGRAYAVDTGVGDIVYVVR